MLINLLFKHQPQLMTDAPVFRAVLEQVDDPANLSLLQAFILASGIYGLQPDLILDLGTGMGNSGAIFGLIAERVGAEVHTFDINPNWEIALSRLKAPFRAKVAANVTAHGDITKYDFESLLKPASRVFVFWDAHGFDVAQYVLSGVIPIIADRPHLVLCHDMSDNRFCGPKSYEGKSIWGLKSGSTAYVNLSWVCSHAAQAIAILDFCWRNDLSFHSVDEELHKRADPGERSAFCAATGLDENAGAHMGYFTMMETNIRNFPARLAND